MLNRKLGKIGVYGSKTRSLQRRLTFEAFGLTFKLADVYRYLGSRAEDNPDINDIQSKVFYEVPDRAYDSEPIRIPVGVEPIVEGKMDFSRYGILAPLSNENMFRFHIDDFIAIGRPLIVGDVFEIDFFNNTDDPFCGDKNERRFWEVTDVDLKGSYEKYIAIVHATPLSKDRTTREIGFDFDHSNLMDDIMDGAREDYSEVVKNPDPEYVENPPKETVDLRDKQHKSFLDDPNARF